ncbi:MAG: PIG-L family deacetylase, partial [Actinobacteria bacterium]|nr:PIG-L family deacetylase [Actinomycetota bacterium]
APHPDDETLGAGGTATKWAEMGHDVTVLTVSGHLPPLYPPEVYEETVSEAIAAYEILGVAHHHWLQIPATMIGDEPVHVLNERVGTIVREVAPHVVLCAYPDRHIDHRLIFDSVMVATRPVGVGQQIHVVAAYETLSETHWNAAHIEPNFIPNWTVNITDHIDAKLRALACYGSQIPAFPGPRSIEATKSLAMFRGSQAGFAYGESFHIIRMTS